MDLKAWLAHNLAISSHSFMSLPWNIFFGIFVWKAWGQRNASIFNDYGSDSKIIKESVTIG